jgi:heat-inducible transcriptional repressor
MVRGCTWNEIDTERASLTVLEEEILDSITEILREEDRTNKADHYMDGLRNLFSQPEFADNAAVAGFVEGIEDGSLAQSILHQTPDSAVVKVVIGHENQDDLLQPMGVVIGRYGVPGEIAGSIAAVGPVRMQYKKAISSIELMSDVMSELVGSVSGT